MSNPRITAKDKMLIWGALRRVFARSELHKSIVDESIVQHSDPERPRVKTWSRCAGCGKPEAKSYMDVDHISPTTPLTITTKDFIQTLTIDQMADILWSERNNLQILCPLCHNSKSQAENAQRRANKKRKNGK
jgi:5-methylcytosine-specific restriction endonuclease McrA